MTNRKQSRTETVVKEVHKPFLTGDAFDENTLKNSLFFFGTLIIVFFVTFIACASASFSSLILRLTINIAVIAVSCIIFYNNGAGRGADAVIRGEILYQKQEKGQAFSESEKKVCFHPMKGFIIGIIGTIPFLIAAVILAANTTIQTTESGALPSWMQAYIRRSDIGDALTNYTQSEGMKMIDVVRALVRSCILPFVNITGYSNRYGMLIIERISPVILLLPAVSYGTGYLTGKKIRTRIHTVISENDRKRVRRENRRRNKRNNVRNREPEQLN